MGVMEKDGVRYCDGYGQKLMKTAKLVSNEGGKELCLSCRMREAQEKGIRH
jgi:hypothetical protein